MDDSERLQRHAIFVEKVANKFLELHGVCVHHSETGIVETPLDDSTLAQLLSPGMHMRQDFFRLNGGVTEWILDPQWVEFDPNDPTAFWWYCNSYFRRHVRQPFSKDEIHRIVNDLSCLFGDELPVFEIMRYLLLLAIGVCDGNVEFSSPFISIREARHYKTVEIVAFENPYWYRAVYHRGEASRNSHCVVSFTPFLLSDHKQPPHDNVNALSFNVRSNLEGQCLGLER